MRLFAFGRETVGSCLTSSMFRDVLFDSVFTACLTEGNLVKRDGRIYIYTHIYVLCPMCYVSVHPCLVEKKHQLNVSHIKVFAADNDSELGLNNLQKKHLMIKSYH